MLLNDFLKTNNLVNTLDKQISTLTEQSKSVNNPSAIQAERNENGETFAQVLAKNTVDANRGVQFSGHALRRIESRSIDITENSKLDRLNKGVELAARKGSNDALVLVDSTAFLVSVKNNKVITTMSGADLHGNVFTNIDSTIII